MNKSADPCDDFYTYVCGSWPTNYPVPEDKFKWDLDGMVEQKIQSVLKSMLTYIIIIFWKIKLV